MTYGEIKKALADHGIESPSDEARMLISHFCHVDTAEILASPGKDYGTEALLRAIEKRCLRVPLQYIIGEWDFYGCRFKVNENCLIPRYDTEIAVGAAIEFLRGRKSRNFADLCTGSGCIAVSILKNLPDSRAIALEKFPATADLACENAKLNSVEKRFELVCADVFDGCLPTDEGGLDLIISNPPYIPAAVVDTLSPEVLCEPRAALDGGADGLDFYSAIIPAYAKYLKPDGVFIFEIGYDQGDALRALAERNGFECRIRTDLDGHERVATLSHII